MVTEFHRGRFLKNKNLKKCKNAIKSGGGGGGGGRGVGRTMVYVVLGAKNIPGGEPP